MGKFDKVKLSTALIKTFKSSPLLSSASILLILAINSVTPLSFLWIFHQFYSFFLKTRGANSKRRFKYTKYLLSVYSLIEIFFFFYQRYLIHKAERKKTKIPKLPFERVEVLMDQAVTIDDDPSRFFSKWAWNANPDHIRMENVMEWVSFAFFGVNTHGLDKQTHERLRSLVSKHFKKKKVELKPGTNETIQFMKPFLYRLNVKYRPFIYYFVTDTILSNIGNLTMTQVMGFKYKKQGVLNYWIRAPLCAEVNCLEPIIFIHGIGSGIIIYARFLRHMSNSETCRNRHIIIIDIACISMRYPSTDCSEIADVETTLDSITSILECESIQKRGIYIGHSFGTVVLAWIMNEREDIYKQCIFIDPICFALYQPDITYNFVNRQPTTVPLLFMWYFVCREFGIAYVIGRHFWWFQNLLIANEHTQNLHKIKVFLSEEDCVINCQSVAKYLKKHGIAHVIGREHVHGTFLFNKSSWCQVLQWIEDA